MLLRNLILILAMLGLLPLGFFLMRRLDRYLDGSHKDTEEAEKKSSEGPSRVFLSDRSSDEEILEAIHNYRKSHDHLSIVISEDETEKK